MIRLKYLGWVLSSFVVWCALPASAHAVENTWDYAVQLSSVVQDSPARITLNWPQDTNGTPSSYAVYRKAPGATSWDGGTTLPGSATSYTDTTVAAATAYEYRIVKAANGYTGYGYILTGVNVPLVDAHGKLILIVDNTMAGPLASELARLQQDLVGDGWAVLRHDVGRNDAPASVRDLIRADYNADPANVQSVFLFGHVPVPYSGLLNPDGHPDHLGAWPADVYYGDVDGTWTDSTVNYVQTQHRYAFDNARSTNVPGDGKFDQTEIPSKVELEVGRVDLANQPGDDYWGIEALILSETELLRQYLKKDHDFRHRIVNTPRRGLVSDYLGVLGGQAPASSAFRSFTPLFGANNVRNLSREVNGAEGVFINEVAANDYLMVGAFAYSAYVALMGMGSAGPGLGAPMHEFISRDTHGVFTLMFGSWHGDWDHPDTVLKAPLMTTHGLVSVWSGRPHWFFHPMGLGATVGSIARLTQNNQGLYEAQQNSWTHDIHIALMGDPTLRLHPVVPPQNINGRASGSTVALTWLASSDSAIVGYHVYRADSAGGAFRRLTTTPITALTFTDSSGSSSATYMVRAIKLENTTSGSYYNPSQGAFWPDNGGSTTTAPTTGTTTTATTTPTTTTAPTSTTTPVAGDVLWFDDVLPTGASGSASGGDGWNWVGANPAPFSGTAAHQSNLAAGLHEHAFGWGVGLSIATGDKLITYVHLDPANPPTEIMLSWNSGSWEHRAYWGADKIPYGNKGTPGHYYAGSLPAAGEWVRLEVPASAVGLEGQTATMMSFSLFDGRATWDHTARNDGSTATTTTTPTTTSSTTTTTTPTTTTAPTSTPADIVWFDDALPAGATGGASANDAWNWITGNPTPFSGTKAHQSAIAAGLHEHYFGWGQGLPLAAGDRLFVEVYLDPANLPGEIMLSWNSDSWEHRAYWGADRITYGQAGSAGRYYAGPLPAAGQWVRLEVPASAVGLEGHTVTMMGFSQFDGRATWDRTGKTSGAATTQSTPPPSTTTPATTATTTGNDSFVWIDDQLPAGATGVGVGADTWNWVSASPAPISGTRAHQSALASGLHEHYFAWGATMSVNAADKLYTYVYLDPANPPTAIMLSWSADNWEHRAYWGADRIDYGTRGTAGRYYAGPLPAAGQWVRLEVPASAVELEGKTATAMCFSTFDGRVTYDKSGK